MAWLVQTRLVNEPTGDPGLLIDFRFGRRAILFDLGDLGAVSARELYRVSDVFVSHMHVDHFIGFDRLLRICLHRQGGLNLVGPPGLIAAVQSKLGAYTWNLLDETSIDFAVTVGEVGETGYQARTVFRAREAFRRREIDLPQIPEGIALDEEEFRIEFAVLDHGTPCLAFALQEKLRVNVWRDRLDGMGLPVGPWLNDAKAAVRRGEADDYPVRISEDRIVGLGELRRSAFRIARGQRIAYVVDAAFSEPGIGRILSLARNADQLFIEAPFLDADSEIAAERRHLTAWQAGSLARRAGAARMVPLHFSPRYAGHEDRLAQEAEGAFSGAESDAPVSSRSYL